MNSIVERILREIEKGSAFDSHFIIDKIIRDYSDDYLTFVAENPASSNVTQYVHGKLAKVIATFRGKLVQDLPYKSWSYNIRGKASHCVLWERI